MILERRDFVKQGIYSSLAVYLGMSLLSSCKSGKMLNPLSIPAGASYQMGVLRNNIGYFSERGGTIGWLADRDGIVIIDTQFEEQARHLLDRLQAMGVDKIDFVVNTHHHGDHTAGNSVFRSLANQIIAHQNSKANQLANAKKNNASDSVVLPDTVFTKNYERKLGSHRVSMSYFGPAHTNGDIIVHFENDNIMHIGDLVFNRRFPYIDKGAGAMIDNWIKVLDKIYHSCDKETILMWGHAEEGYDIKGDRDQLLPFKNYLERLLEFGMKSIKSGVSLEEALANTSIIPGAEEWTGKGIERSINAVYEELAQ